MNLDRRQVLMGSAALGAALPVRVLAASSGASGDGIADDAPAIQAALDQLGRAGGGTVKLPPPRRHYRIARGLKLPSHVVLEGPAAVQYPFNAGNAGAGALVADFADPRQWIIEAATTSGGRPIDFDIIVNGALPSGATYNCGVRNLLITSTNTPPFGGIRLHGCPGSRVEGTAIDRVGCGLLVNYSFGGTYDVHVNALYYGVAAWEEANANVFRVYCTQRDPLPGVVPEAYRLPFLAQMGGHFADTLKLATNDHAARPYGVLCGASRSTSTGNAFDAVVEKFAGGIFLYNSYATDFRQCYLEAGAGGMKTAIAASRSRFSIQALHAYLSGTGTVFDFGLNVMGKIVASGIVHPRSFGKPPEDDGSSTLTLEGILPSMPGAPVQRGIRYLVSDAPWIPLALQGGWRSAPGETAPAVRFDPWSHQIELRGAMVGGAKGPCFQVLPVCRPEVRRRFSVVGGQLDLAASGVAVVSPSDRVVWLDGVSFAKW